MMTNPTLLDTINKCLDNYLKVHYEAMCETLDDPSLKLGEDSKKDYREYTETLGKHIDNFEILKNLF